MKVLKPLSLILAILISQLLMANYESTPTQSFRANLILNQFFRNFEDKSMNQARIQFAKEVSGIDLTLKEAKTVFSKVKFYSNSKCLVCINGFKQQLSFNISNDKRKMIVGVNGRTQEFPLATFSVKKLNHFFKESEKLNLDKKHSSLLKYVPFASAHAFGSRRAWASTAQLGALFGPIASAAVIVATGVVASPLVVTAAGAAVIGGIGYSLYKAYDIDKQVKQVASGEICCDLRNPLFTKTEKEKEEFMKDAVKSLTTSCVQNVNKFKAALDDPNRTRGRVEINEMSKKMSAELESISNHAFIQKSLGGFLKKGENAGLVLQRCLEAKENITRITLDNEALEPSRITEQGHNCRESFQEAWKDFQLTPEYRTTELINKCRSKMSEISLQEQQGNETFNRNRDNYGKDLGSYSESAEQIIKAYNR